MTAYYPVAAFWHFPDAPGGSLTFYSSGTTTPKVVYSDQAGSVSLGSVVSLDSAGRPTNGGSPVNPLLGSGEYTCVIKKSDGSTLRTIDDIGGSDSALRADLADTTSSTNGAGMVAFSYANNYVVDAIGALIKALAVNVLMDPYHATGLGVVDDSSAIQAAITANPGKAIYLPSGTYRLNSGLTYTTTSSSVYTPGLKIIGDGPGLSIIDVRAASTSAIAVDTDTASKFQLGGYIKDIEIMSGASPASANGISLRRAYSFVLDNVYIHGLTGDGIKFPVSGGDADACNNITIRNSRIASCAGWGINVAVTGAYNEFSFLTTENVYIASCGTASATVPPPSGGMRWKGQQWNAFNTSISTCENIGLYIDGGVGVGGLPNSVYLESCTFENNKKRGIYSDGIDGFRTINCQIYNNDTYTATNGVEFTGAGATIRNVDMRGTLVRATTNNNAYTAFKISGTNAELQSCRVSGTSWGVFDYTGQTRFNGFQFEQVQNNCELIVSSSVLLTFKPKSISALGNCVPLRLRGGGGGTPSTSGEWISYQVPSGGLTISNSGLANSTRYYVYLYDNNGIATLELSTTVYVTDTATGYSVKTGDATRTYLGSVITDGAAAFLTANTGWLNPTRIAGSQTGVDVWTWYSGTSAALRRTVAALPTSDTDGALV